MSTANVRETKIALSYRKQAALQVEAAAGNYWSLTKTNSALADITLNSEDDAQDIGKGNEFAANVYLTNWDARIPYEKFTSSEILAWLFAFGLGKYTETTPATGAHRYTCTPQAPITDGIELPQFTYVEAIRPGGSSLVDRASAGNVVESFSLKMASGPGRANCTLSMEFVGCGVIVEPSGVTVPAVTTEHFLNAGSATITILGSNYTTLKRLVSLDMGWSNNHRLEQGFFPGSGTNNGGAVRGRMEFGDRKATLSFQVRLESSSTELDNLLAQTEGTAVIAMQGALITGSTFNDATITFHRVRIKAAVVGDDQGIVTVKVGCEPLYHSTNGLLTAVITTETAGIGAIEV